MQETITCPTCKSLNFNKSILGPTRCSFCDGTEGGHPPELPLIVGATYRAKPVNLMSYERADIHDRTILWISEDGNRIQYDAPTVKWGKNYQTVTREAFLKWAGHRL